MFVSDILIVLHGFKYSCRATPLLVVQTPQEERSPTGTLRSSTHWASRRLSLPQPHLSQNSNDHVRHTTRKVPRILHVTHNRRTCVSRRALARVWNGNPHDEVGGVTACWQHTFSVGTLVDGTLVHRIGICLVLAHLDRFQPDWRKRTPQHLGGFAMTVDHTLACEHDWAAQTAFSQKPSGRNPQCTCCRRPSGLHPWTAHKCKHRWVESLWPYESKPSSIATN